MKNLFNRKKYLFILALSTVLLPHSVFASTLYIDTNRSDFSVGDTVLFRVRIDSENQDINTVEGEVLLDYPVGAASLAGISTADSQFSLWPGKPLPSENNTSISFVGGSPGGLLATDAIVFNFALKLQETGQITLSPNNIGVYLNDGNGTKDTVTENDLLIYVMPETTDTQSTDDWKTTISQDKTAPESFEITIGKDPSIFDNRYFISFFTTDTESGVAYYEVQEGEADFVRAESPYVLTDQSLSGLIKVKAVDRAGNEKVVEFKPATSSVTLAAINYRLVMWVAAIFLVLFAIVSLLWKVISRKK